MSNLRDIRYDMRCQKPLGEAGSEESGPYDGVVNFMLSSRPLLAA